MTPNCTLQIKALELHVNLGWPEEERQKKQPVWLDIDIQFSTPPKACQSDELSDSFCYDELCQKIHAFVETKHFHLVEYLAAEIYNHLKPNLPTKSGLTIRLLKHPKVVGLTEGVCFVYGDSH